MLKVILIINLFLSVSSCSTYEKKDQKVDQELYLNNDLSDQELFKIASDHISSDNFDIDINKNLAIAYNDVIVSDPKSTVKAGKITLDILTKDISINPQGNKKIKITTN